MIELAKTHPLWFGIMFLAMIFSLRLALGLWLLPRHKETRVSKRVLWTIVVLIPFIGPMFYGGFYRIPKSHSDGGAKVNSAAMSGGHL